MKKRRGKVKYGGMKKAMETVYQNYIRKHKRGKVQKVKQGERDKGLGKGERGL